MSISEERMRILQLLADEKITAEEANRLLSALNQASKKTTTPRTRQPRHLKVRITDLKTGRNKVSVSIPMSLVNIGLKMGARFIPSDANIDIHRLQSAIENGEFGKLVELDDPDSDERVEVWLE
ncbi:MAG: hypothetical protein CUN55_03360 [Phototrophicales bacterium]|nr:MAG: hypothetical protein CUN55_03360 [Phototrophicales bacterium]